MLPQYNHQHKMTPKDTQNSNYCNKFTQVQPTMIEYPHNVAPKWFQNNLTTLNNLINNMNRNTQILSTLCETLRFFEKKINDMDDELMLLKSYNDTNISPNTQNNANNPTNTQNITKVTQNNENVTIVTENNENIVTRSQNIETNTQNKLNNSNNAENSFKIREIDNDDTKQIKIIRKMTQ